jgi:hypothetical protein
MRVERGREKGRIEGPELCFDGALEWLSGEARMRLDHNSNFNALFASRRPGYVQQVSFIYFCDMFFFLAI